MEARPVIAHQKTDDLHNEDMHGFDSLVSLETIEHLAHPWVWLGSLSGDVKELILSVPIIPTKHANPFHLHDFTEADVLGNLERLGWRVTDKEYQDEWQPKAVLLVRAER
jgi:2-polyprenyl-3-methyl-5-hydroxy-6-metoxy-1,4-benzoquinol methylase